MSTNYSSNCLNSPTRCLKNAPPYCDDNFVKSLLIFKKFSPLESLLNLLQNNI